MKRFEDFVERGVVKKRVADLGRAESLRREALRKKDFLDSVLDKIGVADDNANDVVESCYDVLMGFVRSRMFGDGFFSSGFSAHEAEVSFLGVLGFCEEDICFVDRLRYFRNGMLYYGKRFDSEYALKVVAFLRKALEGLDGD